MNGSRRSAAVRIAACTAVMAVLLPLAAATAGSLQEVWSGLVGRKGILEGKSCGYVFTPSRPTQSGNAVVKSAESDHVVLVVERDQSKHELFIPLQHITLRREGGSSS